MSKVPEISGRGTVATSFFYYYFSFFLPIKLYNTGFIIILSLPLFGSCQLTEKVFNIITLLVF